MSILYKPEDQPGIMSLFPKPCSGVGVGALHGSRKDKEALRSSGRRKINSDFGAEHWGARAAALLYSFLLSLVW